MVDSDVRRALQARETAGLKTERLEGGVHSTNCSRCHFLRSIKTCREMVGVQIERKLKPYCLVASDRNSRQTSSNLKKKEGCSQWVALASGTAVSRDFKIF